MLQILSTEIHQHRDSSCAGRAGRGRCSTDPAPRAGRRLPARRGRTPRSGLTRGTRPAARPPQQAPPRAPPLQAAENRRSSPTSGRRPAPSRDSGLGGTRRGAGRLRRTAPENPDADRGSRRDRGDRGRCGHRRGDVRQEARTTRSPDRPPRPPAPPASSRCRRSPSFSSVAPPPAGEPAGLPLRPPTKDNAPFTARALFPGKKFLTNGREFTKTALTTDHPVHRRRPLRPRPGPQRERLPQADPAPRTSRAASPSPSAWRSSATPRTRPSCRRWRST